MTFQVIEGDATEQLTKLDPGSVQTCITSPPYWGLRDYGDENQLGLEPTPEQYVANLVAVFREVRRVLRDDGTVWLNLGDSYTADHAQRRRNPGNRGIGAGIPGIDSAREGRPPVGGLKPKDLVGIPWMVAFALRADGWWLRSDIVWSKPNPMPESVTDRPTRSHEYLFLLTKSARYFYDADAIREVHTSLEATSRRTVMDNKTAPNGSAERVVDLAKRDRLEYFGEGGRNKRSVWTVATQPFPGAHFATFPPKLIEPCVLAGSPPKCCGECGAPWDRVTETKKFAPPTNAPLERQEHAATSYADAHGSDGRDSTRASLHVQTLGWRSTCRCVSETINNAVVLDPFAGAGTTGVVALRHDRDFIGIELNPDYAQMARDRIRDDAPLFNVEAV